MNYSKLAELHTNIWWQHDAKQFKQLEKTAQQFLIQLGFDKKQSKKASKTIRESYQEYDKKNYDKMKQKHDQTMSILNFSTENGKLYSIWWIKFAQRDKIKIILALLNYHYAFFKGIKKIIVPKSTILFVLAGLLGHNKRNKKITKLFLNLYWRTILLFEKKFIIY
jgi:predicted RecB family nuclease